MLVIFYPIPLSFHLRNKTKRPKKEQVVISGFCSIVIFFFFYRHDYALMTKNVYVLKLFVLTVSLMLMLITYQQLSTQTAYFTSK